MKKILFLGLLTILASCTSKINYSVISVPEEGGIKFTQYTKEDELVLGPAVRPYGQKLLWDAATFISVAPNNEMLAYLVRKNNNDNIYIKNIKGGNATIQRTFRNYITDFNFSPDSREIAFTDLTNNSRNIFVINSKEGSAVKQIAATNAQEINPAFSFDGESVFYSRSEGEYTVVDKGDAFTQTKYYIWSANLESGLFTQYSEGTNPCPLPDGKQILVSRNNKETGNGEIWLIDTEKGTESVIIRDRDRGFSSPKISPNGKKVMCVGMTPKTRDKRLNLDLYLFNIDGTGETQLTFHEGYDVCPAWSPDGKSIFFISQRGNQKGSWNVWKLDAQSLY
jgi:Tol biopolymer transport system component